MTFLAPLFLAGLIAIAVPIYVHLTHRERRDPIAFPSLMFLERVPFKTTRRQRIRNWFLLVLRAAAIVLLVAAFARPLLEGATLGGGTVGTAREVVLLLDRSASMMYEDRWDRAQTAARDAIADLGPDDRLTVIAFSDRPEVLHEPSADAATLTGIVNGLVPDGAATRYGPALQLARDLLDQSALPHREAVFITDFQSSGWDAQADVRLPGGATVTHVDVAGAPPENRAVTGVVLDRSAADGGRVTVAARVAHYGAGSGAPREARLEIDGQVMQTLRVAVPAGGSTLIRFAPVAIPPRPTRGRVVLDTDRLPGDDAFRFLIRPIPAIGVLLLEHPDAPGTESLYLRRALEVARDPGIDLAVRRSSRVGADDLAGRAVVVLNDVPFPGGPAGQRLTTFVRNGGGLLVAFGPRSGALAAALRDSVGGPTGEPVDRLADRGGTISIADYTHPVFQPFSRPRSGDFSAARFFRYRRLTEPPAGDALARLDDGTPALVAARLGAGRILSWASGFGNVWNNLPLQPVFLPFVHEAVRYLAGFAEQPSSYVAGQVLEFASLGYEPETEVVTEAPGGTRTAVTLGGANQHVELRETGFYTIRPLDAAAGAAVAIPVNHHPDESNLERADLEEVLAAIRPTNGAVTATAVEARELGPRDRERRQRLWWYMLFAVLAVLAVETLVAHHASRRMA